MRKNDRRPHVAWAAWIAAAGFASLIPEAPAAVATQEEQADESNPVWGPMSQEQVRWRARRDELVLRRLAAEDADNDGEVAKLNEQIAGNDELRATRLSKLKEVHGKELYDRAFNRLERQEKTRRAIEDLERASDRHAVVRMRLNARQADAEAAGDRAALKAIAAQRKENDAALTQRRQDVRDQYGEEIHTRAVAARQEAREFDKVVEALIEEDARFRDRRAELRAARRAADEAGNAGEVKKLEEQAANNKALRERRFAQWESDLSPADYSKAQARLVRYRELERVADENARRRGGKEGDSTPMDRPGVGDATTGGGAAGNAPPSVARGEVERAAKERAKVVQLLGGALARDDRGGEKEDGQRAKVYREHARVVRLQLDEERQEHTKLLNQILTKMVAEAETGRLERVDLMLRLAGDEVERHEAVVKALLADLRGSAPNPKDLKDRRQGDR